MDIKWDLRLSSNDDAYCNLMVACDVMNIENNGHTYLIRDVWRDFGAGIMATTIVVMTSKGGSYQISPNQCEAIKAAKNKIEFIDAVRQLAESEAEMIRKWG